MLVEAGRERGAPVGRRAVRGERELHARIEGMRNGVLKGIDFPLARVSCDATVEAGK